MVMGPALFQEAVDVCSTPKFKLQDSHRARERLRIVGSYEEALLEKLSTSDFLCVYI